MKNLLFALLLGASFPALAGFSCVPNGIGKICQGTGIHRGITLRCRTILASSCTQEIGSVIQRPQTWREYNAQQERIEAETALIREQIRLMKKAQ